MAKQMMFGDEAWWKVVDGVTTLSRAVKATLGPTGKTVILDKSFGKPEPTKDGVTVSKDIELADPFENMAAKLVTEVASKTNDDVGDGTTTATILAEAILREGVRHLAAGHDANLIRDGIHRAVETATKEIRKLAKPVKSKSDIEMVATISANNDPELGALIADAIDKVGRDGMINVEEGSSIDTQCETVDGMKFDKGYISPYFVTDATNQVVEFDDAYILIHEKKISAARDLVPALEAVAQSGKPLLIVAEDIEGDALAVLVLNKLRGVLRVCAVKAPAFGDRRKAMLEDLAILTGGTVISEASGRNLDSVTAADLGTAKNILVDKDNTTLIQGGGKKADISTRIKEIEARIAATESNYDREKLEERLARLQGKVAVIHVGGRTESEMKERKYRVEDAVNASQKAVEEGIVPGGGVAYVRAQGAVAKLAKSTTTDEQYGMAIVLAALEAPLRQIASNSGWDPSQVFDEVFEAKGAIGFNAATGTFEDLVKAGVVDPAAVTVSALENAASVSATLLTTRVLVTDAESSVGEIAGAVS